MQATARLKVAARRPRARRPDRSPAQIARDMMVVLAYCQKRAGGQFFALVDELELGLPQIKMLDRLDASDEVLSVHELAELLAMSLPATSRNVESLLKRGYLERREDERDRRVKRVQLTPQGRETIRRLNDSKIAGLEEFVASLEEGPRRKLADALVTVLEREQISVVRPPLSSSAPHTRVNPDAKAS